MKISAIRPAYLPPLKLYWQLAQADVVLFADHLQYVKRSDITTSAPLTEKGQRLRIPVKHDPAPQPIARKITDSQDNWRRKHRQTLRHVYHDYPFAYYYLPQMEEWYARPQDKLADFLFDFAVHLSDFLHFEIKWLRSSEMSHINPSHEDFIIRSAGDGKAAHYLTEGGAGLDWDVLQQAGIQPEPFEPLPDAHIFQSYGDVSILTFLMQFGPEAGFMIRQFMPDKQFRIKNE